MPTALVLSPHLDDAAFSCGGTLAALADAGWRVQLVTIFTASVPNPQGFALACQLDKGLGSEIDYMALRRAEDAEAARALGIVAPLWLPFAEAPHRGYESAKALFGDVRSDDAIERDVANAIRDLIDEVKPDLIFAPQAVGGHADHVQTMRALRRAAPAVPVLYWRDYPYTVREADPPEPFGPDMARLRSFAADLTPEQRERKRMACRAYASQLGFQFGGAERLDAMLARAEETFRCEGAIALSFLRERQSAQGLCAL